MRLAAAIRITDFLAKFHFEISASSSILKLPPELLQIDAMLRRFLRADKDHRNIPTITFL